LQPKIAGKADGSKIAKLLLAHLNKGV
jgi:hypothetical protein